MRTLVTGAKGSIGTLLVPQLEGDVVATDVDTFDVTRARRNDLGGYDLIYHLAGAKHAPVGEEDPEETFRINVVGTENIIRAAKGRAKIVFASTCKACNPETVYGATKLIAERMVLNAGGVVARFYNVRETCGNVFRLWEGLAPDEPVPYTDCSRFFISVDQAVKLLLACSMLPSGRYTVDPGRPRHMRDEAEALYPHRELVEVPRRRGDRAKEPLCATNERVLPSVQGILRIVSYNDE